MVSSAHFLRPPHRWQGVLSLCEDSGLLQETQARYPHPWTHKPSKICPHSARINLVPFLQTRWPCPSLLLPLIAEAASSNVLHLFQGLHIFAFKDLLFPSSFSNQKHCHSKLLFQIWTIKKSILKIEKKKTKKTGKVGKMAEELGTPFQLVPWI